MQILAAKDSRLFLGARHSTQHAKVEIMHVLWGILMAAVGLFMLVCGTLKSEFLNLRNTPASGKRPKAAAVRSSRSSLG